MVLYPVHSQIYTNLCTQDGGQCENKGWPLGSSHSAPGNQKLATPTYQNRPDQPEEIDSDPQNASNQAKLTTVLL